MKLWMLQWNGYVPGAGAANVAVLPASMVTLKPPAPSAVTVCREELSFLTVTVAPALTGVVVKVNAELIVICALLDADAGGAVVAEPE